MITVAIANLKGVCGKSTSSISVSGALAEMGKRVLLVDSDPQGSIAATFGLKVEGDRTLYEAVSGIRPLSDVILPTDFGIDGAARPDRQHLADGVARRPRHRC